MGCFEMLKEHDKDKEPAQLKAGRLWRNHAVTKRMIEARQKPKLVDPNKPPDVAEIVTNLGRRDARVTRFENKFRKEIRSMMEGHANFNLKKYVAWLEHRRVILLTEKLRRLKLAQQESEVKEGSNV
jgi:hypothetical protein